MRNNNNITEEQHLSGAISLNQTHPTSADVVAGFINFGAVDATTKIL